MIRRLLVISSCLILSLPLYAAEIKKKQPDTLVTEPIGLGNFIQMFIGLAVVIGLIFLVAWVVRRMGKVQRRVHGAIKVLAGVNVGQRERVVLIQVGEKQILIGIAPGQIRTLHELDEPVEALETEGGMAAESFAQRLQSVLKGRVQ